MRALLDTNIVIHRENTIVSNQGIGLLFYWLDKLNYTKCIHPFVIEELRSHKNTELQRLYDVKLTSYEVLGQNSSFPPNAVFGKKRLCFS